MERNNLGGIVVSSEPVLQLHNVTKKIGRRVIVDQLTFDVPKGEVFGFLGPNGAGKTTTIRMIVGLIKMTKGEVIVNGISIKNNFQLAMTHIGAIVENPEMYKFLSGYQNLLLFARRHQQVTKARIDEVIQLVGLQHRIHDKVKKYSLGMRQRLGVAQALLHKPSVLIFDEPTNGLDPAGIRELRDYLRKLAKEEGIAVIVSSHLLSEMELMCDRIAIIQNGKLIDIRKIHELRQQVGVQQVTIEVSDAIAAQQHVQAFYPDLAVVIQGNSIQLVIDRSTIPEVVRYLVHQQIDLFSIQLGQQSLEDQFLQLTGGEQIV
ncbi:ABC transporter ATP-binding protein [Paenibacillus yanchengensis]|uniref:ABC transporter ATP-binding protein n=1 Tax=Paenibacillus yanchengensis TaxID=2035833 RepID=A0ABW4YQ54_9BACL